MMANSDHLKVTLHAVSSYLVICLINQINQRVCRNSSPPGSYMPGMQNRRTTMGVTLNELPKRRRIQGNCRPCAQQQGNIHPGC